MILVTVHPTGDSAEAVTPADAVAAARTMMNEARDAGCPRPLARFYVDGKMVRQIERCLGTEGGQR